DPVRVYQRYATLDAVSNGRAEIMIGRASFIESFPLFGYNLNDYEDLFNEKLQLLLKINEHEVVSWDGKLRPSFDSTGIYPRVEHGKLPISIATGGTPESSLRDPVRVYQRYATLDAVSNGRAEIMIGRASFIESF
ncbi:LLM class flavin-dependent oxidoreductase, partial [Staphylococcus aureus]